MSGWNKHQDFALVLGLSGVVLLSRLTLLYRTGSPEPDSLAMVAGMTMALRGDVPFSDAFLYGRQGSPGLYLVGRFIYPLFSRDPVHLLGFLNGLTVLASVALVWPAYGLARRCFSRGVSATSVLLFACAPAVWELSTYFHPEMPAAALLLFALYVSGDADSSRHPTSRRIGALVLAAASFLCRFHVAFVLAGVAAAAFFSRRRVRNLVWLASALAACAVAYTAVQVAAGGDGKHASFPGYVSMIYHMYRHGMSVPGLTRSVVWAFSGIGVATIASLPAIPWLMRKRRVDDSERHQVTIGALWALPSLAFWLPQPTPILRHYVLTTAGVAWLAAAGALTRLAPRRLAVVAVVIIAGNVAIPEAAYRVYNARHPSAPKTPHGAVFYAHEIAMRRVDRYGAFTKAVLEAMSAPGCGGALVFATWESYANLVYALSVSDGGAVIESRSMLLHGVMDQRVRAGEDQVRVIIYTYFEDADLQRLGIEAAREAAAAGRVIFAPRELVGGPMAGRFGELDVVSY